MQIGLSGHQRLSDPGRWQWVRRELGACLASVPPPVAGITSLAVGADTLFAEIVLELGGSLKVIVPFSDYEERFVDHRDRETYRKLLGRAAGVETLHKTGSDDEAYYASGKRVVDLSDLLILVWNGKPAAGLGGTGDIAEYARQTQKAVIHLNPETQTVTR